MTVDLTNDFFIVQKNNDTFKVKGENLPDVDGYLIVQRAGSTYKMLVSNATSVLEDDPNNEDWLVVQQAGSTYKVKGSTVIEQLFSTGPNPSSEGIINVEFIPQGGDTFAEVATNTRNRVTTRFAPRAHETIVPTGSEIYISDHWQQGTADVNVLFNGQGFTAYQPITEQFPNQSNYVGDDGSRGGIGTITFDPPVVSKTPIWVYMAAQAEGFFPRVNDVEFEIIKDCQWRWYNTGQCVINKISWLRSGVGYSCQSGFACFSSNGTFAGRMGATQAEHDDNELTFESADNLNTFVVGDEVIMSNKQGEKAGYRPKTSLIRQVAERSTATPNYNFTNSTLQFGDFESGSIGFFYTPAEQQNTTGLKFRPNYGGIFFGFTLQVWDKLEICMFNQYGQGAGLPVGNLGINVSGQNIAGSGINCGPIQWQSRSGGPTGPMVYTDYTPKLPATRPYTITSIGTYGGAGGDSTYWYGMKVDGKRLLDGGDLGENRFILTLTDNKDLVYFKKGDKVNQDSYVVETNLETATIVVAGPSTSKWKGSSTGDPAGSEYVEAVEPISGTGVVRSIDMNGPKLLLRDANNQWVPSNGTKFYAAYQDPPLAEGVVGPVTRFYRDSEYAPTEAFVYVRGLVDESFVNGARLYECDAQGNPMCPKWDQTHNWSTEGTAGGGMINLNAAFDGNNNWNGMKMMPGSPGATSTYTMPAGSQILVDVNGEELIRLWCTWTYMPATGFAVNGVAFNDRCVPDFLITNSTNCDQTNVEAELNVSGNRLDRFQCHWSTSGQGQLAMFWGVDYWDPTVGYTRQLVDQGVKNTWDIAEAIPSTGTFQVTDPLNSTIPTSFSVGSYLKVMTTREKAASDAKIAAQKHRDEQWRSQMESQYGIKF